MKKLPKLLVKIAVILILLMAVGLLVLRLMFPPQKLKQMAIAYATENFHREISFDKLSFNWIGFTLENFAMSENSTFAQGTFIKVHRLDAKASWKSLLQMRPKINGIYLDGVEVSIQKNTDGSFNFDSLFSTSSGTDTVTTPAQESAPSTFGFTAKRIRATGCDFLYTDKQSGLTTGLQKLNFQLNNVDFDTPFPIKISFVSNTKDRTGLALSVPVNISLNLFLAGLDMSKAYADIAGVDISYKDIKVALQGKIANFNTPEVNITGSATGLSNTALTDILPDLPNFSLPTLNLSLQANADLDKSTATLQNISLKMLDSQLSANGNLNWGGTAPTYSLTAKLKADISQVVTMTDDTGFDPNGLLSATLTATDKKEGKDIKGTFSFQNVGAFYPPFTLTQTNGTLQIDSLDNISCPSLSGQLNGEKFDLSFVYKSLTDVPDLILKLNVDKLTLDKFPTSTDTNQPTTPEQDVAPVSSATPEKYFNVQADVRVGPIQVPYFRTDGLTANATLTNISSSMNKTNGTVSFSLQPGAITDLNTFIQRSNVARIMLLPLNILNAVTKKLNINLFEAETQAQKGEIAMTTAYGQYTFTNGVMTLEKTKFESALTDLNVSGTTNFVTKELDMKASATLLTKQTPIVIKIGGTLDDPSGKLDLVNTVTSVVGGLMNYKTATSAVTGTAHAVTAATGTAVKGATAVTGAAIKGATTVTTTTVKDTAKVASSAIKAIGGLFKKKSDDTAPQTINN